MVNGNTGTVMQEVAKRLEQLSFRRRVRKFSNSDPSEVILWSVLKKQDEKLKPKNWRKKPLVTKMRQYLYVKKQKEEMTPSSSEININISRHQKL